LRPLVPAAGLPLMKCVMSALDVKAVGAAMAVSWLINAV
jgi:hypothetical protein